MKKIKVSEMQKLSFSDVRFTGTHSQLVTGEANPLPGGKPQGIHSGKDLRPVSKLLTRS